MTETTTQSGSQGYAKPETLVSTDWAAQHLNDSAIRLVEVDVDTDAFDSGHIPGAVGWNWKIDLQRHPMRDIPTKQEWEQLLSRTGIGNDTTVVLYGDNNNWFAAFAYWLFKVYGHDDVRLLNGGRAKWLAENREQTQEVVTHNSAQYTAQEANRELRASRDQVANAVEGGTGNLVDVRSPGEFSGELLAPANLPQEGAQRGGHIPSAKSVPWSTAVAEDGTFKPAVELREVYLGKGLTPDSEAFAYCRIGERSAHTWFVLRELLGFPTVRNYDGSWTEWGSLIGAPIETGK